MPLLNIQITRLISDEQPGFVECVFYDAWNNKQVIHEKVPVITEEHLDANSTYPKNGAIACEIIREWHDGDGRHLFTIDTENPWGVITVDNRNEFDVTEQQLIKT